MIRHHLVGAAHIDRIGTLTEAATFAQSNPGGMRESVGGAALNVASSLTALGARVSLSSALGDDASGAHIRAVAAQRKIDLHLLPHDGAHPTATYTGLLNPDGDLIIALADMEIYGTAKVQHTVLAEDDWLLVDANLPSDAIGALLQKSSAHRTGMTVSAAKAERLRPHVHRLDLLFTNRAEVAALVGASSDETLASLGKMLANLGCPRAVISDGAAPLVSLDNGEITERAIASAPVKDVTGAGDALVAGTLFALSQGIAFGDAIETGIAASRAILAYSGPYRDDLADVIGAAV